MRARGEWGVARLVICRMVEPRPTMEQEQRWPLSHGGPCRAPVSHHLRRRKVVLPQLELASALPNSKRGDNQTVTSRLAAVFVVWMAFALRASNAQQDRDPMRFAGTRILFYRLGRTAPSVPTGCGDYSRRERSPDGLNQRRLSQPQPCPPCPWALPQAKGQTAPGSAKLLAWTHEGRTASQVRGTFPEAWRQFDRPWETGRWWGPAPQTRLDPKGLASNDPLGRQEND